MSPESSSTASDHQALLASFLALLNSPSPLTLPPPTLLGAFTHFLSTLPPPSLYKFISALINSPSAWTTPSISYGDIRHAVRLAVPAAVTRIEKETAGAYFASSKQRRRARAWLDNVLSSVKKEENTPQQTEALVGLLEGLDDVEMDWGGVRGTLEDAVVLGLAQMIEVESQGWMGLLCAVMPHVGVDRLKALDMKILAIRIEQELYSAITAPPASSSSTHSAPSLARALARAFTVLNTGGAPSKQAACASMRTFCVRMQAIAEDLEKQWTPDPEAASDPAWETHKTALFSFLLPASTILDLLLDEASAPMADSYTITHLAARLLVTLAAFSYLTDASKGGFENYHRILYGSLDIIAARGGTAASEELFGELSGTERTERMADARAAFVLVVGDELVRHLGSRSIRVLLPLAERHAHRPVHRSSFEAAHALFISLLRSSAETMATAHPQGDFFDALLPAYLAILCKQAASGDITADQLKEAFPVILSASSLRSNASINLCFTFLNTLPPSPATRQTRILAAPYLPSPALPAYLDDLAQMILGVDRDSPERLELASTVFKMVLHELRDEVKRVGVEWWMRWRWEFEGRERREAGFLKSRL